MNKIVLIILFAGVSLLGLTFISGIGIAQASPLNASEVAQNGMFPVEVVVLGSDVHPMFSSSEIISAYTYQEYGDRGPWLGDFSEGSTLLLHVVDPLWDACLVQGVSVQGWETTGWVYCYALSLK